jgi:hypothetical protein
MFKTKWLLILSTICFATSFILSTLHLEFSNSKTLIASTFYLSLVFLSETVTLHLKNYSFIRVIIKSRLNLLSFVIVSILGAAILEMVAQWIGKLWFYPFFTNQIYFSIFPYATSIYWLVIVESYLAVKIGLDYLYKGEHRSRDTYSLIEKKLYPKLGYISLILIPPIFLLLISEYDKFGGYFFEIRRVVSININFILILLLFFSAWFILEMVEFFRKRKSLIKSITEGYYNPIIAIYIASFVTALAMESKNYYLEKYWVYANWPFQDVKFIGLPIVMLLAWPLHYIFFLSLMRSITNEDSSEIWADDNIK